MVIVSAVGLVLLGGPANAQSAVAPWDGDPTTVTRIGGDTPRTFAVNLAATLPDNNASHAIVVSDQSFADALSASGLAQFGVFFFAGPDTGLDAEALTHMSRLLSAGSTVYIIGGTAAVTTDVESQVSGAGFDPVRLSGASRFETSVAVADVVASRSFEDRLPDAYLARAFGPVDNPTAAWADSVSGGPAASTGGVPLLLTGSDGLHPAVGAWLSSNQPARVTVLGGTAAVPQTVADAVTQPTRRVSGATRDETAEQIAHRLLRDSFTFPVPLIAVNLFDDQGWAYGLATSGIAAGNAAAIVAVHPEVDLASSQRVTACGRPTDLIIAGPEAMVPAARVEAMRTCPDGIAAGSAATDPIALRGDGLGADIDFGADEDSVIGALTDRFGPPTGDTGRVQPTCELAGPDDPAGRVVTFDNGLEAGFREVQGAMFFHYWNYTGIRGDPATLAGVENGDTNGSVASAYGADARLRPGDELGFPPPLWEIDTPEGPLTALASGNDDGSTLTLLNGGSLTFCE